MSEPRPKNCKQCQDSATLHLSKVVDGKLVKLALCAKCPKAAQAKAGWGWDLIDASEGAPEPSRPRLNESACPGCGLTAADFKETGRLGCARCYETFEDKLEGVIRKLHRGSTHLGKAPRGRRKVVSREEIAALKRRLQEHVNREEFEMAAAVRDQLRSLEK